MSIPIKREPGAERPFERCCFCFEPTPYWYVKADVACCRACAATHETREVPSKDEWCKQVGLKFPSLRLLMGGSPRRP